MRKVRTLDKLVPIMHELKKKGYRIVLANGCFDLVHVGHIRYLMASKSKGDILVLALNSDASIKKLKGKGRPILKKKERAEIFSAFACVDYITFFDEDKVDRVLLALKPHVHAKGSDYREETVPERETVLSYGGEIAIAGGPKVRWTSEIIGEIVSKMRKSDKN